MDFKTISEKRRSINFFDEKRDVTDTLLKEMVTIAAKAPSSFNLQPWNLVALRDADSKEKLRALAWDQPKITEAPVTLIVLADKTGWQEGNATLEKNWREMLDAGSMTPEQRDWFLDAAKSLYGSDPEASLAFAVKNAGFFAMGLMYAATSIGLETHPMDGFDREGVRKAFSIPDKYWIPLLISVGYLREGVEVVPPKWRKTYDEIVVSFD